MKDRLKTLRKELDLSQEEFGKRLGVGKSAISYLESGRSSLTEQTIKLICKEFSVDYGWLTLGVGVMFSSSDSDAMARIDYIMTGEDNIAKRVFTEFSKLSEDEWRVIEKIIDGISNNVTKK